MKTKAEIEERINELQKRREGFSDRARMSSEDLSLALRITELMWAIDR